MPKTPAYRIRKGYDQALVTLTDALTKKRRDYWLGQHGTPESREAYHRVIAEWESLNRRLPDPDAGRPAPGAEPDMRLTVNEMIARFWKWASANHTATERDNYRTVLRLLRQMDGTTPAEAFGPRRLRLIREAMIRGDEHAVPPREPWSRGYINQQVKRVRRVFKWAVAHELIPPSVTQSLAAVEPLKRGRCVARENEKVGPADPVVVEGAMAFLNRQVRALVELQIATGARPGELLGMRPVDIDMDSAPGVWIFRPTDHKNAHRGDTRSIYLGPRAQEAIRPFLAGRRLDAPLFSPAEAEEERRARAHSQRKTPLSCGNRPGTNRRDEPKKRSGDRYTATSYYRAIHYACDAAFPPPAPLGKIPGETNAQWSSRLTKQQREDLDAWRKRHRFYPYQLRHLAATQIRRQFGLEAAQLALGHSSALVTDAVYAERDERRVIEVMRQVG
jgi:integrase